MEIITKPALHSYTVSNGKQSINLVIDYQKKSFDIMPNNKTEFGFLGVTTDKKDYIGNILSLINNAKNFACELLKDEVILDEAHRKEFSRNR